MGEVAACPDEGTVSSDTSLCRKLQWVLVRMTEKSHTQPLRASDKVWGPILEIAPQRGSGVPEDVRADEAAGDPPEATGKTVCILNLCLQGTLTGGREIGPSL